MKKIKFLGSVALFALLSTSAFALKIGDITEDWVKNFNSQADEISNGFDDFSKQLAAAVPQAATQQNVWSDAYIGQLISLPPHLGGGVNIGFTHIDTSGLKQAIEALQLDDIDIKSSYYFPVFTADLRIGGILLPFDFDIAVMKTGKMSTSQFGADLDVDLLTVGMDVRYALFKGGLIMPKISVGAGYFYNQGTFGVSSDYAKANVDYKVHTMYLQAQVSKTFLFVTPFVGLRGLVSKADNTWDWAYSGAYAEQIENVAGTLGAKVKDNGSYKTDSFDFNAIQPQIFAGVGVNFFVLDFTLSITADLRHITDDGLWSGAASLRLSL